VCVETDAVKVLGHAVGWLVQLPWWAVAPPWQPGGCGDRVPVVDVMADVVTDITKSKRSQKRVRHILYLSTSVAK
jgi:hypothetical protein